MSGERMSRASLLFLMASSVMVAAAVALGLWVTPSPLIQREINLDKRRVNDLIDIAQATLAYQRANRRLPASLHDLPEAATLNLVDPANGAAYGYVLNDARAFKLCAEFATVSEKAVKSHPPETSGWKHQGGLHCFAFSAPAGTMEKGQD